MTIVKTVVKQAYRRYTRRADAKRAAWAYFPQMHSPDHPTAWTFPASLDNPACAWLQALKGLYARPFTFPASLSPEAGLLLHALVRNIRPRVVVETGCFIGASTIWIAGALKEAGDGGIIHSFDDFTPMTEGPWRATPLASDRRAFVQEQLDRAGVANAVVLHAGDSAEQIRRLRPKLEMNGGVQFAFIDADHSVRGAVRDFEAVEPLIPTGGSILLHDIYPEHCGGHLGPRYILDHVATIGRGAYETSEIYLSPVNYGMGLLRRIG